MSEFLYLMRLNGFILSNQNIFKLGRCGDYYQRLPNYTSLSEIYVIYQKAIIRENQIDSHLSIWSI